MRLRDHLSFFLSILNFDYEPWALDDVIGAPVGFAKSQSD